MGAESEVSEPNQAAGVPFPEDAEALLDAARYGDLEDLMSLVMAGIPLGSKDGQGRTALHMAAANGHLNVVDYLVGRGANTPLHWACVNGHVQVVKNLILAGADASLLNSHERSPIDEAVSRGNLEVVDAINTAAAQLELMCAVVS